MWSSVEDRPGIVGPQLSLNEKWIAYMRGFGKALRSSGFLCRETDETFNDHNRQ